MVVVLVCFALFSFGFGGFFVCLFVCFLFLDVKNKFFGEMAYMYLASISAVHPPYSQKNKNVH